MKKRKIHITFRTNSYDTEYNLLGEYDKEHNILTYFENSSLVTKVTIDLNQQELRRDNKDYQLIYHFLENEVTDNSIFLKEMNQELCLKLKTKKFSFSQNKLEIIYILLDSEEKVIYQIEF